SDFEGKRNRASAALLRLGAFGFVRQEELQRRKEEAPEVAFVRVRAFEVFAFEQERKETLSEVPGLVRRVAAPADIRIQRIPVSFAQISQRVPAGGAGIAGGGQHQGPSGRRKIRR